MQRGILEPTGKFTEPKQKETYQLTAKTSHLNSEKHDTLDQLVITLNENLLVHTEQKIDIEYEAETINYKNELLKGYKLAFDPFNSEIGA
jgi:hypothetical protein